MKKTITIAFILIATTCFSQKDSTKVDSLTSVTPFISMADIAKFNAYLRNAFNVNDYEKILKGLQPVIDKAEAEYYKRKKKK